MTNNTQGSLLAGAARIDITPPDLSGLTNLWRTPFTGIHDLLYVRALVVDNGLNRAVIVAADLVEFGDTSTVRQQIETELGIPAAHVIITASHDHNAPRAGSVTPGATAQKGGPATERYTQFVYGRILDAVRAAQAALQPARIGIGRGTADANTYRNVFMPEGWCFGANSDGPSDKTVWVVKLETAVGEPLALLINYAVHSVSIGPHNTLVTGDLAGAVERYVERAYDDKLVALWTIGPAGDQNPKYLTWDEASPHGDRTDPYALMNSLGQFVGEEVLQVAGRIERTNAQVRIAAGERVVTCPARIPPRDANRPGMEVKAVAALDIRLGLIQIDQIALTAVSGEVVTNIYRRLQRESPFANTLMITMANDRVGYIVNDAGYDTPTFESTASPLQRGHAESAIVNGLVDMMTHTES